MVNTSRSPAKKIRSSSDRAEVADDNDWELRFEWKREGTWIPGIPRIHGTFTVDLPLHDFW